MILLEEVAKYWNIIECKTTNKINKKEKDYVWDKILASYSQRVGVVTKKVEQLQGKYDNLKTKAKKVVAESKKNILGTGGGPSNNDHIDPVIQAVLNILNSKLVAGLKPQHDCDTDVVRTILVALDFFKYNYFRFV